jgi:4-hydroxythreonine-4-phosphate dehydrogenase
MPYPITTPEHGTAFDIAGKGIAKTGAAENAVIIAAKMAGWREEKETSA